MRTVYLGTWTLKALFAVGSGTSVFLEVAAKYSRAFSRGVVSALPEGSNCPYPKLNFSVT